MATKYRNVEYMCSKCGLKTSRSATVGRPAPGTCLKKANKGPHSWVIARKW